MRQDEKSQIASPKINKDQLSIRKNRAISGIPNNSGSGLDNGQLSFFQAHRASAEQGRRSRPCREFCWEPPMRGRMGRLGLTPSGDRAVRAGGELTIMPCIMSKRERGEASWRGACGGVRMVRLFWRGKQHAMVAVSKPAYTSRRAERLPAGSQFSQGFQ